MEFTSKAETPECAATAAGPTQSTSMAKIAKAEDSEVLVLKLREVNKVIRTYEEKIEQANNAIFTFKVNDVTADPGELAQTINQATIPMVLVGVAQSLIATDLENARAKLGGSWKARQASLLASMAPVFSKASANVSGGPAIEISRNEIDDVAGDIINFLKSCLEPYLLLRQKIEAELNRRTASKIKETPKQEARRVRDNRIEELRKEYPRASVSELLRKALNDPIIKGVEKLVPITIDVVGNAVDRAKKRGKK